MERLGLRIYLYETMGAIRKVMKAALYELGGKNKGHKGDASGKRSRLVQLDGLYGTLLRCSKECLQLFVPFLHTVHTETS